MLYLDIEWTGGSGKYELVQIEGGTSEVLHRITDIY